jgi:vacuolar-type H+-ATPase subunit H
LSSNVIVDQARALDLLDQLRVAVPEEIRAAKRINEETERIVERAQEEAERILARAQEQAAFLIEERELTRAAEIRSAEIISDGQREADEIRRGADEYAQSVLVKLEGECIRALQSIKRGLALLDDRHVDEQPGDPSPGTPDELAPPGDPERLEPGHSEGTRAQL